VCAVVVSRVENSGSDVAGSPKVALPPPSTSTIRLRIIKVSNGVMDYFLCSVVSVLCCFLVHFVVTTEYRPDDLVPVYTIIHHVRKTRSHKILGITLTDLDTISYFLAQIILRTHFTEKICRDVRVGMMKCSCYGGAVLSITDCAGGGLWTVLGAEC